MDALFKKIICYLSYLLPWFLAFILFRGDSSYYLGLRLPNFAPNPILFGIIWTILYFLIAYSCYHVYRDSNSNYKIYLVINYLSNQLFPFCFFTLENLFLALVDVIIVLISSMYLYVETKILQEKYAKYLIPYILWNIFAFILMFTIFVMN